MDFFIFYTLQLPALIKFGDKYCTDAEGIVILLRRLATPIRAIDIGLGWYKVDMTINKLLYYCRD